MSVPEIRCMGQIALRALTEDVVDAHWLRSCVLGPLTTDKTFAEVGGLWGTVNETVSTALQFGAREATMIDIQPLGNHTWTRFHERCAELGVSGYHSVVGGLDNARLVDDVGQ